jgi:hypothetical protein
MGLLAVRMVAGLEELQLEEENSNQKIAGLVLIPTVRGQRTQRHGEEENEVVAEEEGEVDAALDAMSLVVPPVEVGQRDWVHELESHETEVLSGQWKLVYSKRIWGEMVWRETATVALVEARRPGERSAFGQFQF